MSVDACRYDYLGEVKTVIEMNCAVDNNRDSKVIDQSNLNIVNSIIATPDVDLGITDTTYNAAIQRYCQCQCQ